MMDTRFQNMESNLALQRFEDRSRAANDAAAVVIQALHLPPASNPAHASTSGVPPYDHPMPIQLPSFSTTAYPSLSSYTDPPMPHVALAAPVQFSGNAPMAITTTVPPLQSSSSHPPTHAPTTVHQPAMVAATSPHFSQPAAHHHFSPASVPAQLSSIAGHLVDGLSTSDTTLPPSYSAHPVHGDPHPNRPFIGSSPFRHSRPSTYAHPVHPSPSKGLLVQMAPTSSFNGPNFFSHPHASPLSTQTLAHPNVAGPSHPYPVTAGPTHVGPLGSSTFGVVSYTPAGQLVQTWPCPPPAFTSNDHYGDTGPMDDNFHGCGRG